MKVVYHRPHVGCYRIGRDVQIRGDTVICNYPLRVLRPGPTALRLLASCIEERTCADLAALLKMPIKRVERLCEQLYWKGLLDAGPTIEPERWPGVSIVIPTYNRAQQLERCLVALLNLDYPFECMEILVVDDASSDSTSAVLECFGRECAAKGIALHVVKHTRQQGVALARNSGAERASKDVVAFIDSDCVATPGWLKELTLLFEDPASSAVGGMIRAHERRSMFGKYEDVCSSLFMGVRPQQVRLAGPLTYLPTANFLVRRAAWQEVGGFAPLAFGEDVDFCRRLLLHGAAIRYEPRGIVLHDYRTTLSGFLKTRVSYASAEASLLKRHPIERRVLILPPEQATFAGLTMGGVMGAFGLLRKVGGNMPERSRRSESESAGERGRRKRPHHPSTPPPPLRQYFSQHYVGTGVDDVGGGGACAALVLTADMNRGRPQGYLSGHCPDERRREQLQPYLSGHFPDERQGGRPQGVPLRNSSTPALTRARAGEGGRPQGVPLRNSSTPALTMITAISFILAIIFTLWGAYKRLVALRRQRVWLNPFVVLRATVRGHLAYVYHLCNHLTRYYTLFMLTMGVICPPLLLLAFILCSIVIGVDYVRLRPRMSLGSFVLCSLLDDCAYEVGVLLGCIKQRTWKPLFPVVKVRTRARATLAVALVSDSLQ